MSEPWTILSSVAPSEVLGPLALAAGFAAAAMGLAWHLRLGTDVLAGRCPIVPVRASLGAAALVLVLESSTRGMAAWPGWVMVLACAGMLGLVRGWVPATPMSGAVPAAMPSDSAASENRPARRAA